MTSGTGPVGGETRRRRPGGGESRSTGRTNPSTTRYGIHPVLEALGAGVVEQVLVAGSARSDAVARRARYLGVPVDEVAPGDLDRLTGGARHQGVAAIVKPHAYLPFDELRVRVAAAREEPLLIVLDGVEDPQNLGAVLRTAEGAGALAVVVSERGSAPATAAVARASSGALDRVPMVRAASLTGTLHLLKRDGFRVVGLDGDAPQAYDDAPFHGRLALVAGSEGRGLRRGVVEACDVVVRIPLHGAVASLNVSVAVAVVAFAIQVARRRPAIAPTEA